MRQSALVAPTNKSRCRTQLERHMTEHEEDREVRHLLSDEPVYHRTNNHPAIVLSRTDEAEDRIVVCLSTSFGGCPLHEAMWTNYRRRTEEYLKFEDPDIHNASNWDLCLDGGLFMKRKGYADCRDLLVVGWRGTTKYSDAYGNAFKLSAELLQLLLERVDRCIGYRPSREQ
ncbi:hypothetical protein K431DRAFT_87695 [Polychaeton citri CBS 116435]|uniref:Uncharacterized protein n=1 Tax=Polychaeton citri CBS 116435 TaxID=1314669 RepID=A0A9P4UNK9_9PEZI|nr:hypothetical protein K431DRAFT_87695 [Polychaeton citri CBS 116435]